MELKKQGVALGDSAGGVGQHPDLGFDARGAEECTT